MKWKIKIPCNSGKSNFSETNSNGSESPRIAITSSNLGTNLKKLRWIFSWQTYFFLLPVTKVNFGLSIRAFFMDWIGLVDILNDLIDR